MSNQRKKQVKDKTTRLQFASPSASIYNNDSTIIINPGSKKDNKSISKLTELLMISLYMYLLFVIFINIYKLI